MTINVSHLQNKQIYLFGLGREGYSTYNFLREHFPEKKLILIDDKPPSELAKHWSQAAQNPYSTITTPDTFDERELTNAVLFKSPGIPPNHPLLQEAEENAVTVSSNTNLFFKLLEDTNKKTTIGVTGTKGKSTTAALIHHVLSKAGKNAKLGGNIGVPPLDLLTQNTTTNSADIFVLELSSHQLRELDYSPQYAVIQNITPEHLDYYDNFESYLAAKSKIVQFQTEHDYVLYNPLFDLPSAIAKKSPAHNLLFGTKQVNTAEPLSFVSQNTIYYQQEEVIELDELPLKGEHNIENTLPAVIIGKQLGIATEKIRQGLISFQPLAHRLEEVTTKNGITFVNDSLSTTPQATMAAIHSYNRKPIILIAGGYDRGQDFSALAQEITRHDVRALLYFNPTGKRLAKKLQEYKPTITTEAVETMEEAVAGAIQHAPNQAVVLLSPASASFGTFTDYKDRGNQFKKAVRQLSVPDQ